MEATGHSINKLLASIVDLTKRIILLTKGDATDNISEGDKEKGKQGIGWKCMCNMFDGLKE